AEELGATRAAVLRVRRASCAVGSEPRVERALVRLVARRRSRRVGAGARSARGRAAGGTRGRARRTTHAARAGGARARAHQPDRHPTLYRPNSYYFPYLAMRYEYQEDPGLIFKARPTHWVVEEAHGDQYRTEYERFGAEPDIFRAELSLNDQGFRDDKPNGPV